MTTTGRTTRCSANRVKAAGSASRTLVSRTYVRRCTELATQTPLGAGNEGRHRGQDTHRPGSSGDKRVGWTGAAPLERAAPALSSHESATGGLPRGAAWGAARHY